MEEQRIIRPQPGPQEAFLSTSADIAFFGGTAGCGKSYVLLMEATRHIAIPTYGATIFRREAVQITKKGGLWDTARQIMPSFDGMERQNPSYKFIFPSKAEISFEHLQLPDSVRAYDGSQIAMIGFDELHHFTEDQFTYMLSRNRSTCGIRPYVRATLNPDPDSWILKYVSWWIGEDGYPIKERSGVIRYFSKADEALVWGDTREEVMALCNCEPHEVKSFTFISAKLSDNKILESANPEYRGSLKLLNRVERARLLDGNWLVRKTAGMLFRRSEARVIDRVEPGSIERCVRSWDLAGTEPTDVDKNPDWTVGLKLGKYLGINRWVILDVVRFRARSSAVIQTMRDTARVDGREVFIKIPQDPGQAGKYQAATLIGELAGYLVSAGTMSGSKVDRATAVSTQWQNGNIDVLSTVWTDVLLAELEAFPTPGMKDDIVDALADAFNEIANLVSLPPETAGEINDLEELPYEPIGHLETMG